MTNVQRLAGPLVLAGVLALTACGGGGDDDSDAAETTTAVTAFPTIAPVTTVASITIPPPSTVAVGSGPTIPPAPSTTVAGQPGATSASGGSDDDDDGGGGTASAGGVYTVEENDWLEKIADKLDVDYDALLEVNGFTPDSLIVPGQKIKVPGGSSGSGSGSDAGDTDDDDSSDSTAAGSGSGEVAGVYTVQVNDYLAGIAEKLDVDYSDLLSVNGFSDTSVIHPGDKIKVPA